LRDYTISKLLNLTERSGYKIILNGDSESRLPNNINITVEGVSSELLVVELDAKGIEVSERSACSADSDTGSHVIRALRSDSNDSIRITLGRETKKSDLDYLITSLEKILIKYKQWK
jgi:cysteine desulfurase